MSKVVNSDNTITDWQYVSDKVLTDLIDKYEFHFANREKVPVHSEMEYLQLILLGRIWKILQVPVELPEKQK